MLELGLFLFGFLFGGLILTWCGVEMWAGEENTDSSQE